KWHSRDRIVTLGDILVDRKWISQDQLQHATEQCGAAERLDRAIVRLGYCSETNVLTALGQLYQMDVVDLSAGGVHIDLATLKKMPIKLVHKSKLIPLDRHNGSLRVATSDPLQIYAFDELRMFTGLEVEPVLAKESEISEVIKKHLGVGS